MKNASFQKIAERIKDSDYGAFRELFDDLWSDMYSYATAIIMDDIAAKDMVQDIWMDYWKRRQSIQTNSIKSYLFRALRNRCYKYLRDNKLNTSHLEVLQSIATPPEVDERSNFIDTTRVVDKILKSLPARCEEIFRLSRIQCVNNKDIAGRLNISQRSVENQLSLALRKLRKEIAVARNFFFTLYILFSTLHSLL